MSEQPRRRTAECRILEALGVDPMKAKEETLNVEFLGNHAIVSYVALHPLTLTEATALLAKVDRE